MASGVELTRCEGSAEESKAGAPERRTEPRFAVNCECNLRILSPPPLTRMKVVVRDMSTSGLSASVPAPLYIGSVVQLCAGDAVFLGEVRYCIPERAGFRVGVHLEEIFQWRSERRFGFQL